MRSFRLSRVAYALTGVPALFASFFLAGLIKLGQIENGWAGLLALLLLVGWMAAAMGRFRDIGRSGWWTLIILLPLIGPISAIALIFWPPKPGLSDTEESAA